MPAFPEAPLTMHALAAGAIWGHLMGLTCGMAVRQQHFCPLRLLW